MGTGKGLLEGGIGNLGLHGKSTPSDLGDNGRAFLVEGTEMAKAWGQE